MAELGVDESSARAEFGARSARTAWPSRGTDVPVQESRQPAPIFGGKKRVLAVIGVQVRTLL